MKRQVFIVWFFIFIVWAFYRAKFILPESVDEFIVKPLIFLVPPLFLVWVWENKKLKELGISFDVKSFLTDVYIGVVLGIILAVEGLMANYLKYQKFSFEPVAAVLLAGGIGSFLLINLATAFSEEVLGRGFLFGRLYKVTGKQFPSAITASFLFMLLHLPVMFTRLHLTGTALLFYPASIFLMGVTNSYLYTFRRNLVLPILLHAFWNMTVSLYL
ncbi:MAG: hypothetical protein UV73_C0004G0122 [Candidatus Gottesmanbacteria bacterium GW2011_GWA2_43_14]|uniref:CAAX prenyl protease 2/Lysostaphin resistance protein A-like domain-containing protein n=1 Tax=Candidatus Gottesmanbacteria bacterium GW2011_GWA2_43_14 TaxID=1618443 RepID=A0A0G1DJD2_9BACT|nr:MAG: hypothetical protein UV73_C0004G0122 [Candidatus Gottesmanbacteria bacterium GW2011_GWA2_43_14]